MPLPPVRGQRYTCPLWPARGELIDIARWLLLVPAALLLGSALSVYRGYVVLAAQQGTPLRLSARNAATFARETVARAVFAVLGPLAFGRPRMPMMPAGPRAPIVLVPGAWNRSSLWFLAAFLRRRGWLVHVVDRGARESTLADDAMALAAAVRTVRANTGATEVGLVGFGRGGLVAAWFVRHLDGAEQVATLVTLGTPWRGTRMSVFRRGASELRWDNPVLDGLVPPPVPTVCVWSPDDPEVVPTASSVPAEGVEGVCLEGGGHGELLLSARAFRAVETALTRTPVGAAA